MAAAEVQVKTKEKKKKSKKIRAPDSEAIDNVSTSIALPEIEPNPESEPETHGKKRKRDTVATEELEIDVSLPEPLSKKAARKAKKAKTSSTDESTKQTADVTSNDEAGQSEPKEKKERRTQWSIWIGNLPWSATKRDLRDFLGTKASLEQSQITRVHMPAPTSAPPRIGEKPKNKGFAYVDFDSAEALQAALELTETPMGDSARKVLIKKAESFDGRPDEHASAAAAKGSADKGVELGKTNTQKPPSKRVFVGNLGFDTTKEDLESHFGQCGTVADVHMATFEDSGKCKGFAWVTFETAEASAAAVRGWIMKKATEDDSEDSDSEGDDNDDAMKKLKEAGYTEEDLKFDKEAQYIFKQKQKQKKRKQKRLQKWFVNKLYGRMLRCEFAEDPTTRYNKRFGKDAKGKEDRESGAERGGEGNGDVELGEVNDAAPTATVAVAAAGSKSGPAPTSHERRREARKAKKEYGKVDARTIAPGAALANAPRASGAIVGAKGTKITFD